MTVSFNPAISSQKSKVQKTNFKALPIDKIIQNGRKAEMFRMDVSCDRYPKTDENIADLKTAFGKAKDILIKAYLNDVAKKWGFQLP